MLGKYCGLEGIKLLEPKGIEVPYKILDEIFDNIIKEYGFEAVLEDIGGARVYWQKCIDSDYENFPAMVIRDNYTDFTNLPYIATLSWALVEDTLVLPDDTDFENFKAFYEEAYIELKSIFDEAMSKLSKRFKEIEIQLRSEKTED